MVALPISKCGPESTLGPAQDMIPSSSHSNGEKRSGKERMWGVLDSFLKSSPYESISLTAKIQKRFTLFLLLLLFFLLRYNSCTTQLSDSFLFWVYCTRLCKTSPGSNPRTFWSHLGETPYPWAVTPLIPTPPSPWQPWISFLWF